MDEYQHHERLTADANFEDGQWIDGEFFYKKRKQGRQQTEEDRLYGVFQGSSDDDDDGFRKKRKKRANDSAVLHKEVAFVSSGTVTGTTDEKFVVSDKVGALSSGNMLFTCQHSQQHTHLLQEDFVVTVTRPDFSLLSAMTTTL
jgi:hypothetical protein